MKKIILYSFIGLSSMLYGYEPSVYGAGDIDSANPYGLTKTEQAVLENKKTVQMLYNRVKEQERKMEGLTTVIEGQNKEILALKEKVSVLSKQVESKQEDANKSYSFLLELGEMIDNINNSYVSRDELQKILGGSRVQSNNSASLDTSNTYSMETNSADNYRKGIQLFSRGHYSLAKKHFLQALSENYKSAGSNYYLGESLYYLQDYKEAIAYFKQSASLNDQASYMPILYLHTAISLDRVGEKEQAKGFFQYVIDNYPNTKSASIAKKRI
ncbi:TPR repeat containing exported protein; Putative periplasmic protein contains a protein prenylyltransferase domain [hydrothermal vent metagenome]|uniref:TPR repeat containing exported protein Putative periplasmic protein contains a protein prenylyltransferase domain n=1 Tax=hydrothermal vent metagenome TaxID=652676 RepID=A0A1W1BJB3_9ZZZZ